MKHKKAEAQYIPY